MLKRNHYIYVFISILSVLLILIYYFNSIIESYDNRYNNIDFINTFEHDNNVVIGLYNGYGSITTMRGGIKPFIETLRSYNKKCIVVIMSESDKLFPELIELCNKYNVILYTDFVAKPVVSHFRNDSIRKMLEQIDLDINKILLTDVEDVIFQSDPFLINFDEDLYLSEEWGSNGDINFYWMKNCNLRLNSNVNDHKSKKVICNGTILGTKKGIDDYLFFDKEHYYSDNDCLDQGLLNIYIRNQSNSHVCLPVEKSLILSTAGGCIASDLIRDSNGMLLNKAGEVYSIIHNNGRIDLK
jgi:hypothetical protein